MVQEPGPGTPPASAPGPIDPQPPADAAAADATPSAAADPPPTDPPPADPEPADPAAVAPGAATGRPAARPSRRPNLGRGSGSAQGTPVTVVRRPAVETAALRESLADQEAQTAQLREALDELRQSLAAESLPPPPAPGRPRGRRRLLWLLAALVVAVLLAVAVAGVVNARTGGDEPAVVAASPIRPSAVPTGPTDGGVAATPLPWPGGPVLDPPGLATTGPGVDAPGADVMIAVDADRRHVNVYERLRFSTGVSSLALKPAALPAMAPAGRLGTRPVPQDVQVQFGETPVPVTTTPGGSFVATVPGGGTATGAVLRYRLDRALYVLPGTPRPDRFSGVIALLGAVPVLAAGNPVRFRLDQTGVQSITCPGAPAATGPFCGTYDPSGARGEIRPGTPPVLLLLVDLPVR